MKYIIQWEKQKRMVCRVTTLSGITRAYFFNQNDAVAWCNAQS